MGAKPPGAKAAGLGAKLREVRKDRGMSLVEVARVLGWSESKVSRAETGQRKLSSEGVAALLAIYEVTGEDRERLLAMARTPDEPGWLETVRRGLPSDSIALATYEASAERITSWAPLLIPGLLQTMDYTSAYMRADNIPDDELGTRLMARQRRQQALETVGYTAYLDESVLRRPVGGSRVLLNQLRHLVDVAADGRAVLRVVPVEVDAHPGLIGPFLMLESAVSPRMVHVELSRSGVFLSDLEDTDPYVQTLDRLSEISLNPGESVTHIRQVIKEMEGDT